MPRYYFNIAECGGGNLMRDSDGIEFSSVNEARQEARGLARDIARHGLHGSGETWKIVVADENGDEVLSVALSEIRARRIWTWFDPASLITRLKYGLGARPYVSLAAAAGLGIVIQAALTTVLIMQQSGGYQTASAPAEDAVVAIRFVPHASAVDISKFLDSYQASIAGRPRSDGFFRLRIDPRPPKEELAKIVSRITQAKVVEFAAAVQ